ncbi:MAG: glycosyltransferase family 2 protein [Lachnospiraceae bacterium]|nr:glycosyltransferase family 2 protein [Lachnospiraceae bacterium]
MGKKPLIIIPAYKEAENIELLVNNIIDNYPQYDYIIINDGSKDATRSICQKNGYNFIDLPLNLGIGGAVQTGYKYADREGYEIAVQIDGDGQHDVSQLDKVIAPLIMGQTDITIGSRFIERQGFQSSSMRRFGIRFLSGLIRLCTGKKILDVTSGYRAVNRRFIEIYADNYPSDYPEPEAIVAAVMHKGNILEVPVVMKERQAGTTSIHTWKTVYYMLKVTLAIVVCRISFADKK